MSKRLNDTDTTSIKKAVKDEDKGNVVAGPFIGRLYFADGGNWQYTQQMGGITLVKQKNCLYIRIYDPTSYRRKWEQEVYLNFQYSMQKPFLYSFETDVSCLLMKPMPKHLMMPSSRNLRIVGKKKKEDKSVTRDIEISGPTNFRHESHIGWDPDKGFDVRNIPPQWKKLFQQAGIKKSELKDAETAKIVMQTMADASGMSIEQLTRGEAPPPVPKKRPGEKGAAPPPPAGGPGGRAPPPPPGKRGNAPPPPPPPGRAGGSTMANAPPPPPPPPAPGAPPPPGAPAAPKAAAPAPAAAGGGAPRGDFLASIRAGAQLKKVEDTEEEQGEEESAGGGDMASLLAKAMAGRRTAIREHEEDDDDGDDDWED